MVGIQKLWYRLSTQDLLDFFVTNTTQGITKVEAYKRAEKFGYNPVKLFGRSSAHFYKYSTLRGSNWVKVTAKELVLGDLIILKAGDIAPANLRLIKVNSFKVDEEKITGNYVPTAKNSLVCKTICPKPKQRNMVFAGSQVLSGRAVALVVDYNVPKIQHKKQAKTTTILRNNNFVANNNASLLKKIDTVVFDNLKQDYEVIKTVQQIFIEKNIACIYFLDKEIIRQCAKSLPSAKIVNRLDNTLKLGKEVVLIAQPKESQKTKLVSQLKNDNHDVMYVYRGEQYVPASKVADITVVVNKNSSQQSLYNADLITERVILNNLSSILYNKK